MLLDIPLGTLCHYVIPHLKVHEIINLISSTKYHHQTFLLSPSSTGPSNKECVFFSDDFWRRMCVARWKSISFDSSSLVAPRQTICSQPSPYSSSYLENKSDKSLSLWYIEYKKRHAIDIEVKSKIEKIVELEEQIESSDCGAAIDTPQQTNRQKVKILSSLIIQSKTTQIKDVIIQIAKTLHDETDMANISSTSVFQCTRSQTEQKYRQRKYIIVKEILEGVHRFQICTDFQRLLVLEHKVQSDEVKSAKNNKHLSNTEGTEKNADENSNSLEYGATLIAKFYQNANEIISDYDILHVVHSKDASLVTLETHINQELDGMVNFIQHKLRNRLRTTQMLNNETDLISVASNDEGKNSQGHRWPVRWVLEEMKLLFQPPPPRDDGTYDETENDGQEDSDEELNQYLGSRDIVNLSPFHGNEQNYYSHCNSLLDKIIKSRKGIPISLSVLYAAIVKRVSNIDMVAVGLPGHFMLSTYVNDDVSIIVERKTATQVFVDVFHGATVLTKQQCQHLICSRYHIGWDESFIKPVPNSEVWCRMLRNLVNCHHQVVKSSNQNFFQSTLPMHTTDEIQYHKKMLNAARVLLSIGFQLSHVQVELCMGDESFAEIVAMLSTLPET